MKPFRSTGVLALVVVAIAGYTAWEYRKAARNSGVTDQERKLFEFQNDNVEEIKLTRGKDIVQIQRVDGGGWKMLLPVEDQVESTAMDAMLYSAQVQMGKLFRTDDEMKSTKWADFGLEPPGTIVEIKTAKGTETLLVGSKNAFDGSFYLRRGDELLLGDHGLAQAILREPTTFRSRKLWRVPGVQVEKAKVDVADGATKESYALHRDAGKWVIEPAPSFAIDQARVDNWVGAVESLTPSEIVSETLSEDDKRNDLLLKPSLTISIAPGGAKGDWVLTAGQDKDQDVYVYTNQRSTIYKTNHKALAPIRVGREYFRDGKSAFHFPLEQAREIRVNSGKVKHTFKKTDSAWKLDGGTPEQELNADKLAALLQNIGNLEAQEFISGPLKGEPQIVILDGAGKVLLSLHWGDEYKSKKSFNLGHTLRPVKSNLEKDLMGISGSRLTSLVDSGLVLEKAKAK